MTKRNAFRISTNYSYELVRATDGDSAQTREGYSRASLSSQHSRFTKTTLGYEHAFQFNDQSMTVAEGF